MLSLTDTPTCCCLYSTGVWKQAPTRFLSLFRQAAWHTAYHLPQDSMLRIIQLLVCVVNFLPGPTECQALVVIHQQCITAFCVMPMSWHGKDFPLNFTTAQGLERPSKTLHVSVSSLYCSRTPKYQKTSTHLHLWKPVLKAELDMGAQIAGRTILWWEQIWARLWEQIWLTESSAVMQIQNGISDLPGLEKKHSPAVRGQCDPDHYAVAPDVLLHLQGTGSTNCRILQTAKWGFSSYLLSFCDPLEKGKTKHITLLKRSSSFWGRCS